MTTGGIWNIREVIRQNPISPAESIKRTFLVNSEYLSVMVLQAQPRKSYSLHVHKYHDELVYIVEGKGEFTVGAMTRKIGHGDLVCIPRGTIHGPNVAAKGVRLAIYGPHFDAEIPDRMEVQFNK